MFDGPEDYPHQHRRSGHRHHPRDAARHARHRPHRLSRRRRSREHAPTVLSHSSTACTPCRALGDGRQSGTSGSPSILNASPEARRTAISRCCVLATACASTSSRARPTSSFLIPNSARGALLLDAAGGYQYPGSQTPWQEIQRGLAGQLGDGMILEGAEAYQRIAQTRGSPRDNHRTLSCAPAEAGNPGPSGPAALPSRPRLLPSQEQSFTLKDCYGKRRHRPLPPAPRQCRAARARWQRRRLRYPGQ